METGDRVDYVIGCGQLDDYPAYVTGIGPDPDDCEVSWYVGSEPIISDIFKWDEVILFKAAT